MTTPVGVTIVGIANGEKASAAADTGLGISLSARSPPCSLRLKRNAWCENSPRLGNAFVTARASARAVSHGPKSIPQWSSWLKVCARVQRRDSTSVRCVMLRRSWRSAATSMSAAISFRRQWFSLCWRDGDPFAFGRLSVSPLSFTAFGRLSVSPVRFVAFGRLLVSPVCFVAFGRLLVSPIIFTLSFFAFCFGHVHIPLSGWVSSGPRREPYMRAIGAPA